MAAAVALLGGLSLASTSNAHYVDRLLGPAGSYDVMHWDTHMTVNVHTRSFHAAGVPYAHIVHHPGTGMIWGPWIRTDTNTHTVASCTWGGVPYIVRTLHDNRGGGNALYRSNLPESWCQT